MRVRLQKIIYSDFLIILIFFSNLQIQRFPQAGEWKINSKASCNLRNLHLLPNRRHTVKFMARGSL